MLFWSLVLTRVQNHWTKKAQSSTEQSEYEKGFTKFLTVVYFVGNPEHSCKVYKIFKIHNKF